MLGVNGLSMNFKGFFLCFCVYCIFSCVFFLCIGGCDRKRSVSVFFPGSLDSRAVVVRVAVVQADQDYLQAASTLRRKTIYIASY